MPDVVIDNAIKALKQRRAEIDSGIQALESLNGGSAHVRQAGPGAKKGTSRRGKPMSAAVKAKLRAVYAKNHPGWKPKKK